MENNFTSKSVRISKTAKNTKTTIFLLRSSALYFLVSNLVDAGKKDFHLMGTQLEPCVIS